MSNLYIVATPLGNLADLSQRAINSLKEADIILCENPEKTKALLYYFGIKKPLIKYSQRIPILEKEKIFKALKEEKKLALISDAGTPGISDPGGELIEKIVERFGTKVKIIPIPGPSALIAAASISGFRMDKFLFLGFCPKKRKRNKFFEEILKSEYPVIFYESPYRILKTLTALKELFLKEKQEKRPLVVCRELTKKFETIYRGNIEEVIKKLEKDKIKGEFVIVIEGKN